jgi:hypothetical protein
LNQVKDSRQALLGLAIVSLASVTAAAKTGILPVPNGFEYADILIARDLGSSVLGGVLGYLYVKFVTSLAANGTMEPRDSRKVIHTLSAPLYILVWPLYPRRSVGSLPLAYLSLTQHDSIWQPRRP